MDLLFIFNSKRNLCFKHGFAFALGLPNGLRYPRWGGRRNAVRLEKCLGVENCLESRQNPQRRVHALLACFCYGISIPKREKIACIIFSAFIASLEIKLL